MALDDKTREKLRAAAMKRRGVILKDIEPQALYALTDKVKEEKDWGVTPCKELGLDELAYLRYAGPAQVDAVRGQLSGWAGLPGGFCHSDALLEVPTTDWHRAYRRIVLFEFRALQLLLKCAGVSRPQSYICDLAYHSRLAYPLSWRSGGPHADDWHVDIGLDSKGNGLKNWIALLWRMRKEPSFRGETGFQNIDNGPEVVLGNFLSGGEAAEMGRAYAAAHPVPND
jgi:hypothetical protein